MNNNKKYDIAVYGATMPGIIYALKKRAEGKSVLLINRYGFPGGSITAGLNCLQKLKEPERDGFYKEFISSLKNYKYGILYSDENNVLLNPEAVKMILQDMLVANNVDMLFHVTPFNSLAKDIGTLEADLVGKEGSLKVITSSLLDASENFLFSFIHGKFQPYAITKKINLFTTKPLEHSFLMYGGISEYLKLSDGRYWVSLKSIEGSIEKEAGRFIHVLHCSGARIQLMPSEAYTRYEFNREEECPQELVKTAEEVLSKSFLPDEQLLKASEIETL